MRKFSSIGAGAFTAAVLALAACGGGDGDQSPRVAYSAMVVFGDSVSDMGSYATPALVAVTQTDGKYTVNQGGGNTKIWVDHIAAQAGLDPPCAARVGLESRDALAAFAAATVDVPGCTAYAQGGARVTDPVGAGNTALPGNDGALGQLTNPLVEQMNRHLAANGGSYSGTELVTVLAGGNDLLMNLRAIEDAADPVAASQAAGLAMATAGAELAAYVNALIVARGAQHVVVINLPDVSLTPSVQLLPEPQRSTTIAGVLQLVGVFNQQLAAGLAGVPQVVFVDAFTAGQDQAVRPAQYRLSNVAESACDTAAMLIPTALVCTNATLAAGADDRFQYADDVHLTPYGHLLLAQFVAQRMLQEGRL